MKVNLLFVVLITSVFYTPIFAQQKVRDNTIQGTVLPNKDALLELESNSKGLLHARVQLRRADDAAPLSQHRAGMMVYNTATVNDIVPGIYYNNGSRWVLVAAMDDIKPINYDSVTYELTFVDGNDETQVINLEEVVKATETLTAIQLNADTTAILYTDEHGKTTTLQLDSLVQNLETLTAIQLNADTTAILYTDEHGKTTTLQLDSLVQNLETLTAIQLNADTTAILYTDEHGKTTTLQLDSLVQNLETLTAIQLNADTTAILYTDEHGKTTTLQLDSLVQNLETLTAIVGEVTHLGEDGDGPAVYRITYTDEGDEKTEIDIAATNGLHIDGTSGAIKLGGALVYEETEIITTATNTLAITGLQEGDETEDRIVVVDRDGVLKTIPAIIPSAIVKKDANYTAVATDETILVDASGDAVTITLPNDVQTGKKYTIKKIDTSSNKVVLDGNGSDIDGQETITGTLPYQGWTVQFDGENWWVINRI
ncbi:hypothetical protein SAMN05421747_103240 [Parapedobacter composti]|uniref:Uncharacterized protein n=1 Tax=Parapedobacter composti TaxID=623281 RepID=A0A1I1FYJ3_9SPHI|nr:hypothetical protein [Parapedobacter composti]SFC04434.1 hypothetical protein SAMN05421747_103240 [Parapedobacter composti]